MKRIAALACAACISTHGCGAGDEGLTAPSVSDAAGDVGGVAVPTDGAALLPWLQAREYAAFPKESKVHASAGPHGGSVRTYITPSLDGSLAAKASEHPMGAAMVKEFYGGASDVTGWAVAVKTGGSSAGGDNWYWYEIFGTTSATKPVADGKGLAGCKGCHSGGKDFVLSPYPFSEAAPSECAKPSPPADVPRACGRSRSSSRSV